MEGKIAGQVHLSLHLALQMWWGRKELSSLRDSLEPLPGLAHSHSFTAVMWAPTWSYHAGARAQLPNLARAQSVGALGR